MKRTKRSIKFSLTITDPDNFTDLSSSLPLYFYYWTNESDKTFILPRFQPYLKVP